MTIAVITMAVITVISLTTAIVAVLKASEACKANSEVATKFVEIVLNNSDRLDVVKGNEQFSSFSFPNSEGL